MLTRHEEVEVWHKEGKGGKCSWNYLFYNIPNFTQLVDHCIDEIIPNALSVV